MEEIKIYHSLKKNLLLLTCCLVFTFLGINVLVNPHKEISIFGIIMSLLGVLLFGGGSLFVLYQILKERLTGQAYYVITNQSLIMNSGKGFEVRFADVEMFYISKIVGTSLICIRYKPNVEVQRFENSTLLGRLTRRFNVHQVGTQEGLPADGLNIKAQELCNLLNKKVKKA